MFILFLSLSTNNLMITKQEQQKVIEHFQQVLLLRQMVVLPYLLPQHQVHLQEQRRLELVIMQLYLLEVKVIRILTR